MSENLKTPETNWIPMIERQPEPGITVMVWHPFDKIQNIHFARYDSKSGDFKLNPWGWTSCEITHWAIVPQPPVTERIPTKEEANAATKREFRLWQADDATLHDPSRETLDKAWLRIFGESMPPVLAEYDFGDCFAQYRGGTRWSMESFDGPSIYDTAKFRPPTPNLAGFEALRPDPITGEEMEEKERWERGEQ